MMTYLFKMLNAQSYVNKQVTKNQVLVLIILAYFSNLLVAAVSGSTHNIFTPPQTFAIVCPSPENNIGIHWIYALIFDFGLRLRI